DLTGGGRLRLVVTDGGDGIDYDHADSAAPPLSCGSGPAAGSHPLSDLAWSSAVSGWCPVDRDRSNGAQQSGDGRPLGIRGTTYAKGLGAHAYSEIDYYLGGTGTNLGVDVGVDDASHG
ncbi:NPCBM/NEW2 domain-containing protein, partial [Saccharothrix sp. ST-888]|uniref:NPCBM/NEW2 domain-containing protein n=1 Tax=Saccharothrix sp. ST-888 TaxID=1427391 RepID=UPI0005EC60C6